MSWLVTGGAGYIGSHVVRSLRDAGVAPVVVDDLSSGHAEFVSTEIPFLNASIVDHDTVAEFMTAHGVEGVIHVAGFKYAGVSVQRPLHTYTQNVTGTINLLEAMETAGVERIVFSSSAAVYGTPATEVVTEETAKGPESPYGESKLIGEWLLADRGRAHEPFRHTSLRYFNVVGSGHPDLYDTSPHNLFPMVLDRLLAGITPKINGDDYPTPDGTCIRDYVHVSDLAHSHVVAAQRLAAGDRLRPAYNLGSGQGSSNREIMTAIATVTGIDFDPEIGPRRAGDPARIVAGGEWAAADLDWRMRHDIEDMVGSDWTARTAAAQRDDPS